MRVVTAVHAILAHRRLIPSRDVRGALHALEEVLGEVGKISLCALGKGLEEVGADGADTVRDRTTTHPLHLDANLHYEGRSALHANPNETA